MKFLADENFPLRAVDVLRQEGFDVSSIREIQPGASDEWCSHCAQLKGER
jgi:predicted nuclease of predicted toxin-antitoxin system